MYPLITFTESMHQYVLSGVQKNIRHYIIHYETDSIQTLVIILNLFGFYNINFARSEQIKTMKTLVSHIEN